MSGARLRSTAGALLAIALLTGAGFLAGRWAERQLTDTGPAPTSPAPPTAVAIVRDFGHTIPLAIVVTWAPGETVLGPLPSGRITASPFEQAARVREGDVLLEVDDFPVFVVDADRPFYRDLSLGDRGWDVAELQELLAATGQTTETASGPVDQATLDAFNRLVQSTREDAEPKPLTSIPLGSLFAAPVSSPTVLLQVADHQASPGAIAPPTLGVHLIEPESPRVSPVVSRRLPATPGLAAHSPRLGVPLVVDSATVGLDGDIELVFMRSDLDAVDARVVCPVDECELAPPPDLTTIVDGTLDLVPPTTAVAVPSAAVRVAGDGSHFVVTPDRGDVPIEIGVSDDGFTEIRNGLDAGTVVEIP